MEHENLPKPVYYETLQKVRARIPQLPQVQWSTAAQLYLLANVADRLGLYDAADVVRNYLKRGPC